MCLVCSVSCCRPACLHALRWNASKAPQRAFAIVKRARVSAYLPYTSPPSPSAGTTRELYRVNEQLGSVCPRGFFLFQFSSRRRSPSPAGWADISCPLGSHFSTSLSLWAALSHRCLECPPCVRASSPWDAAGDSDFSSEDGTSSDDEARPYSGAEGDVVATEEEANQQELRQRAFTPCFICVVITAMTKFALKYPEFMPRVVLCFSKVIRRGFCVVSCRRDPTLETAEEPGEGVLTRLTHTPV